MDFTSIEKFLNAPTGVEGGIASNILYSIVIIFGLTIIYQAIKRVIAAKVDDHIKQKTISVNIRNFLLIFAAFLIFSTWNSQIKTLFLSTAAITAAIIITFKEVILSFFASFYISSNNLVSIGDEIAYENVRGRVIDKSFTGIRIQSHTLEENKQIFIPNIVFLTTKVTNYSLIEGVCLNLMTIGFKSPDMTIDFYHKISPQIAEIMQFNLKEYQSGFHKITPSDLYYGFNENKNYYIKKDMSDFAKTNLQIYYFSRPEDKEIVEDAILRIYREFLLEIAPTDKKEDKKDN